MDLTDSAWARVWPAWCLASMLDDAYACSCGFTANRAVKLHAHISQHSGEGHDITAYGAYSVPAAAASESDTLDSLPEPPTALPRTPGSAHAGTDPPAPRRTLSPTRYTELSSSDDEAGWEAVGDLDMSDVYGVEQASSPSLDQGPDGPSASGEDSPATPVDELGAERSFAGRMSLAGALKSVSDALWRRPSLAGTPMLTPDKAVSTQTASARAGIQVDADMIEAVLLWEDPSLTGRVLGVGLYILICLRQLSFGTTYMQLSSVLSLGALGALAYNLLRQVWRQRRPAASQAQQQQQQQPAAHEAEAAAQQRAEQVFMQGASYVAPVLAAVYAMARRRLLGTHDRLASSIWLALGLWAAACLGEIRLMGQASYACCLWVGLFALPPLYRTCSPALDALVDEGLGLIIPLLLPGNRPGVLLAGLASIVVSSMVRSSWVVKLSVAACTGAGVLAWWMRAAPARHRVQPERVRLV